MALRGLQSWLDQTRLRFYGSKVSSILPVDLVGSNLYLDGKLVDPKKSILKFEQFSHGDERSLIIKNCKMADFTTYSVKTRDGREQYQAHLHKVSHT